MAYYRLDALALAMSQQYRLLKEIVGKKRNKVPAFPLRGDAVVADCLTDIIERIGGKGIANFCALKFQEAWVGGDYEIYDIRGILERIIEDSSEVTLKDELKKRLDEIIDSIYRLSNPAYVRSTYKAKKNTSMYIQPLLFDNDKEVEKSIESKASKPKAKRKRNTKSKLDKLADEIISEEYRGTDSEVDADYSTEDDFIKDSGVGYDPYTGASLDDM